METVFLIPKGNGYFWGVVLGEVLWKMVMVIFNFRLGTAITFHDALHGFRTIIETGTASF